MKENPNNLSAGFSRRDVLKGTLALGGGGVLACSLAHGAPVSPSPLKLIEGNVILFQGDSITDAGRKKDILEPNDGGALGNGYAAMIAGEMLADYPDLDLRFYNRGISGNKVPDLAARWEEDTINLKPSVLSIMVGINDLWHTVAFGSKYKGTVKDYEDGFRRLIEQSLAAIPGVRIIICEPFELRKWAEFDAYRKVARKLADDMNLTFVPFHEIFTKAAESKGTDGKFWAWDGIHPSIAGHTLMRRAWREAAGL
ncbi:SGNH/GDSL hydrolase family protein [Akkermansiaceae bacterium]|nr:SGNH/GDSL hydrolase family protein [Akkermansiaceae bacterium]